MAVIKTETAERLLSRVPDQYCFFCRDNRVLSDMRELAVGLNHMTDDTYAFHATDGRSDFGSWVSDIIGDDKLARDLLKATSRQQAARQVERRISFLSAKLV